MIEVAINNGAILEQPYAPKDIPVGTIVSSVPYSQTRAENLRIVTVDGLYDFDGYKCSYKAGVGARYYKIPAGTVVTLTVALDDEEKETD
jgi:hypothetical protein